MLERRRAGPILAGALAAGLFLAVGLLFAHMRRPGDPEPGLAPAAAKGADPTSVGVGWSQDPNPTLAARAALKQALDVGPGLAPHTLFVFATDPGPLGPALAELRRQLGRALPVFGGTSDSRGLLTERGLMKQDRGGSPALAVMAIGSPAIAVGVGSSDFGSFASVAEAARAAATRAVENARPGGQPRLLLLVSAGENVKQDELLAGIESVVSRDTPILGASVAAVVLADGVPGEGVAVAALYTDLPIGWAYDSDPRLTARSLEIGMRARVGGRLYLAKGTRQTLFARITNLPTKARERGDIETQPPLLGFGFVSSGVMSLIPARERPKAPLLMSRNEGGTPFLAIVSWDEHGYLPGVGNEYGNLQGSFLAIGPPSPRAAAPSPRR